MALRLFFLFGLLLGYSEINSQVLQIPSDKVVDNSDLYNYLTPEAKQKIGSSEGKDTNELALYFRNEFGDSYFYNWQSFNDRLAIYNDLYSPESGHAARAKDHLGKYADSTQWVLPFNYLNGEPVNAYALRHLARSHKMVDIAFLYFDDNKDPKYIEYFTAQMRSLNAALEQGEYEKIEGGNGVYEVFRSGYRILNWLRIHNMFLGEEAYTEEDQLTTIATMLQHGQHLYERNDSFRSGNHQTRGMSALAMLGILFKDFEGADQWYDRAMQRLEEHLDKEINEDGFQFERSVHYHISDIGNYFYVYQLAKINKVDVSDSWEARLKSLFTTLTYIAYPDKTAPVLQDDTDSPWSEHNEIGEVMALGYLLFENPEFGYFASKRVKPSMYWFLTGDQYSTLNKIDSRRPKVKSLSFDDTGYYIMRKGWEINDPMMVISAGLDDKKPDHQHGDMLGIQAYANGNVLLPNYQVRYSLPDYGFFKNSLVKNVALVDEELQGKKYKGNKGGSGFGKFGELPNPKTLLWNSTKNREWYVGSHDGFEDVGVTYSRQVFVIDNDFWIIKDNFKAESQHSFKQVWQGHYTIVKDQELIRSTFADGSGLDIYQLSQANNITKDGTQGKEWSVFVKENESVYSFLTVLQPFSEYDQCLSESVENIRGWVVDNSGLEVQGSDLRSISKNGTHYLFNVEGIQIGETLFQFDRAVDLYYNEDSLEIHLVNDNEATVTLSGKKKIKINNQVIKKSSVISPGDVLTTNTK